MSADFPTDVVERQEVGEITRTNAIFFSFSKPTSPSGYSGEREEGATQRKHTETIHHLGQAAMCSPPAAAFCFLCHWLSSSIPEAVAHCLFIGCLA